MEALKEKRKDIHLIDVNLIDYFVSYPYRKIDNSDLESLTASLENFGQKEAIKVIRTKDRYVLVHGFKRVKAYQNLFEAGKVNGYILAIILSPKTSYYEALKDYYISNQKKPLSSFDTFDLFLSLWLSSDFKKEENKILEESIIKAISLDLRLKENYVRNLFKRYYKHQAIIIEFRDKYNLNPNITVKLLKKLSKDEIIEKITLCYQNDLTPTYNNIMQDQAVKNVSLTKIQKLLDKNPNLTVLELKKALEENKVNSLFY